MKEIRPASLRQDRRANIAVGSMVGLVIGITVLVIILAALMPTFVDALSDYDNASTDPVAPVLETLGPILLSVAVLLILIGVLLREWNTA